MDPNRSVGEPTMHLCHYPNCGKVYKVTGWAGLKTIKYLNISRKPRIYELTSGGTLVISLISVPGQVRLRFSLYFLAELKVCWLAGCSRKFTRSDELHRHFRIHTGERKHR